jgi:hypothetical protein
MTDEAFLAADAADRRAALAAAVDLASHREDVHVSDGERHPFHWLSLADSAYQWLRDRTTLHAVSVAIVPGKPYPEGSSPMTATIDLSDTDELPFTLTGLDAKDASVPAPTDTWSWTLNDPDSSGAVLTVSADTLSATVAAGTPTPNLSVSVAGASTGLTGAEAIIVQATAATTVGLVAGTPVAEAAAPVATPPAT